MNCARLGVHDDAGIVSADKDTTQKAVSQQYPCLCSVAIGAGQRRRWRPFRSVLWWPAGGRTMVV